MVTAQLYGADWKPQGDVNLQEAVFGQKAKPYLWHEVVKWQLACKREGNAKTKQRNEVNFTTKKMYRQKGTGRARHGSQKAPNFVGGGTVFGPIPRDYSYVLPKKMKQLSLATALSMKLAEKQMKIVANLTLKQGKTKEALALLGKAEFKNALVVDSDNTMLERGLRNLPNYKLIRPEGVNVYDLLRFEGVIITQAALQAIEARLSK